MTRMLSKDTKESKLEPIGKKRIYKLIAHYGNRCFYCGVEVYPNISDNDPQQATVDHVIPTSKAGSGHISNCVVACKVCNTKKGDEIWEEMILGDYENTR